MKLNNYEMNDFLSLFQEKHISQTIHLHDKYLQKNFYKYLNDNFHGNFIIYTTSQISDYLVKFDENSKLFGISWIFPWTSSILRNYFQCFMTDTTFKSMKPYTLTLLNIIISNESIPIGISVFPTETYYSYQRLYDHLKKYMNNHQLNINGLQKRIVCDLGSGLKNL